MKRDMNDKNKSAVENSHNNTTEKEESLNQQVLDLEDKLLRVFAESENIRKRIEKEKEDAVKYCTSNFARDVLTIRDNLILAISNAKDESSVVIDGIKMNLAEMNKILKKHDVNVIEAMGKSFDPNFHEAMFEVVDLEKAPGTVLNVIQDGFMIRDRLLRPALVSISKKS